jgi:O-antigen/teichoic acid export membrane protein
VWKRLQIQVDRKFTSDVTWNVGSLALVGLAGIGLNIVIVRYYGSGTLGAFGQVFAFLMIAGQTAVGGVVFGILHYLPRSEIAGSGRHAIFVSALYATIGLSAAVAVAVWFLGDIFGAVVGSPATGTGLKLASPAVFLLAINKVLLFALNAQRAMRAFAVGQMLRMLFYLLGALILIAMSADAIFLPLSLTIGEFLLTGFLITATRRHFSFSPRMFDSAWVTRLVKYGRDGFFIGLLFDINLKVDVIMLGLFLDDTAVGLYVFMAMFADGFAQLPVILQNNLNPLLSRILHEKPIGSIRAYLVPLHLYFVPVMVLLAGIATLIVPELADVLTGDPTYGDAWPIFAILAAGIAITSGFSPLLFVLNQAGRPDLQTALLAMSLVFNVVGNAILIFIFGLVGAAIATSFATLLSVPTLILLYKRATQRWLWS